MTIKIPPVPPFIADAFHQPVGWNFTSRDCGYCDGTTIEYMMIISPYEANCLMPEIQKSTRVILIVYVHAKIEDFPF